MRSTSARNSPVHALERAGGRLTGAAAAAAAAALWCPGGALAAEPKLGGVYSPPRAPPPRMPVLSGPPFGLPAFRPPPRMPP